MYVIGSFWSVATFLRLWFFCRRGNVASWKTFAPSAKSLKSTEIRVGDRVASKSRPVGSRKEEGGFCRGKTGTEERRGKRGFQSKYTSLAYRWPINYYLRKISSDVATLINISIFLPVKPISFLPMRVRNVASGCCRIARNPLSLSLSLSLSLFLSSSFSRLSIFLRANRTRTREREREREPL